jgi:hypothetical protein
MVDDWWLSKKIVKNIVFILKIVTFALFNRGNNFFIWI